MAKFEAGKPRLSNAGRKKGVPNKSTIEVRTALQNAYTQIGGDKTFAAWATDNQTEFYKLWAKLLPIQVAGSGENGEIVIQTITRKIVDARKP